MRMRRIERTIFENPAIKSEQCFQFNPKLAADHYFAKKLAEAKAAKATATAK